MRKGPLNWKKKGVGRRGGARGEGGGEGARALARWGMGLSGGGQGTAHLILTNPPPPPPNFCPPWHSRGDGL
jgi:hypothetical protein